MQTRGEEREREMGSEPQGRLIEALCLLAGHTPVPVPADERLGAAGLPGTADVGRAGTQEAVVPPVQAVAPQPPQKAAQERQRPQQIEGCGSGAAICGLGGRLRVDVFPEGQAGHVLAQDGPPEGAAVQQPDGVSRDVGQRIPVLPVRSYQFLEGVPHVCKGTGISLDEPPKTVQVTPVELDDAASLKALAYEPYVRRRHGQEWKQGQAGPEVHGHMAAARVRVVAPAFERVGLALAGPPLVLAGQLRRSHVMHEPYQVSHEGLLGVVFG